MAGHVARPNTLVLQWPEQIASLYEYDFMVELFKSIPKPVIRACQFLPKNYIRCRVQRSVLYFSLHSFEVLAAVRLETL